MNRPSSAVCLKVEQLESRQLMAGNVIVEVVGGDLVIRAQNPEDKYSESFRVRQTANDQFTVEGYNGTVVINKSTGIAYTKKTFSGVSDDIRIYTYGGADNIQVLGASKTSRMNIKTDLFIDSGSGNDNITIKHVNVGRNIDIDTKSGIDTTKLRGVRAGDEFTVQDSSTHSGSDYDTVYAELCMAGYSTTNGTLKFDLNDGKDRVYLHTVEADYLDVALWAGDDYFSMVYSNIGQMKKSTVDGGGGTDGINLYRNNAVYYPPENGFVDYWSQGVDPNRVSTKTPTRLPEKSFISD